MTGPRGTDNARVIQVIETISLREEGTDKDKCREVKQYWDFNGELLAENNPCVKEKRVVSYSVFFRSEQEYDNLKIIINANLTK